MFHCHLSPFLMKHVHYNTESEPNKEDGCYVVFKVKILWHSQITVIVWFLKSADSILAVMVPIHTRSSSGISLQLIDRDLKCSTYWWIVKTLFWMRFLWVEIDAALEIRHGSTNAIFCEKLRNSVKKGKTSSVSPMAMPNFYFTVINGSCSNSWAYPKHMTFSLLFYDFSLSILRNPTFQMLCTLLLALLFLPALTENLRMVIVFGRVTVPSETVLTSLSKDECLNKCFFDSYCILASFYSHETCSLYNYITTQTLTVTETDREDGFYVAFKVSSRIFEEFMSVTDFNAIRLLSCFPKFDKLDSDCTRGHVSLDPNGIWMVFQEVRRRLEAVPQKE